MTDLHRWDLSTAEARELQLELRERRVDQPPDVRPRWVAGADVSMNRRGRRGFGAIVVVDLRSMEVVEEAGAVVELGFPYVPGLLSFRELPVLAEAWGRLDRRPDAVLFDAHGYAHPRRFGLASHGGVLFDVPSVGCAKTVLVGEHEEPEAERGSRRPLVHEDEVVGLALRTRTGTRPVYVSVGHRTDLAAAAELVLAASPRFRIPEPIRRAHALANALRRERGRGEGALPAAP